MPRRVLVLFAHPALERSRVNIVLVRHVRDVPGVTFNDLYENYPDFDIDVAREQQLLEAHDVIVLQHPFYWYSTPALIKEWEDLVLEHGWAYGAEGDALVGKLWLSVVTAGGGRETYDRRGGNRFSVRELLAPIEQTGRLCGMRPLPPFVIFGTHQLNEAEIENHGRAYARLLEALIDDRVDLRRAEALEHLTDDLSAILARRG